MKEGEGKVHFESRWPVVLTLVLVLILLVALPERIRVFPDWVPYLTTSIITSVITIVPLSRGHRRWRKVERSMVFLFSIFVGIGNLVSLIYLLEEMISGSSELDGLKLFTSSIALWITNVLVFSLLYWQIDRDGPEARVNNLNIEPDWFFPQSDLPEGMMPGWQPTFVDYLFLSFTTATALSPTDTLPLTKRAKLLIMLESSISLTVIAVIAARAINILGN
jgi:uncharacterized membrane protein